MTGHDRFSLPPHGLVEFQGVLLGARCPKEYRVAGGGSVTVVSAGVPVL